MKSPESQPKQNVDEIKGSYVDISIIEPEEFHTYLEADNPYKTLYSNTYANELPYPMYDAQLGYAQRDGDIGITSDLHFRPNVIDPDDTMCWQDILSSALDIVLIDDGYQVHTLPHELHARHIPLSPDYAAYIRFTTETHRCCVEMCLERIYELEHELGSELIDTSAEEEPDTYKLFKDFATIWAQSIDTVIGEYGRQKKKKPVTQITFKAPQFEQSPSKVASSVESSPESLMPEIERYASSEKSFRMLGGLERPKHKLQSIVDTFNDPIGTKMYGISARHFILYGPSGTGKTSLVEALGGEIKGATLKHVASSAIMAGFVGESGKNLTTIFEEAATHTEPYILFFDEVDAIAGKGNNDSVSHIEVKKLLNQFITNATKNHPNLIIAAATNLDAHQIEDSLTRSGRLAPIAVPLPDEHERCDIWAAVLAQSYVNFSHQTTLTVDNTGDTLHDDQQFIPYADDINPLALALLTEEMTGADFEQILNIARHKCYQHYKQTGESRRVNQADLVEIIEEFER
jgi:ATP-dependent 26S proteasome regulatory subunit